MLLKYWWTNQSSFSPIWLLQGQQHNHNERDELIARERKLQVLVDDLRETMRHQQDTFAHEKKELVLVYYDVFTF